MTAEGRGLRVMLCLVLLAVNVTIAAKLFGVEYSAYTGSVEGSFIAIARVMAKYPGRWGWWPLWDGGMPFETAYLPFSHWIVAAFSLLTGQSAPRSFHLVSASVYVFSALAVFWMALTLSRRPAESFVAALAYSCLSFSTIVVPSIGVDAGGALNLRRLQALVFYGESPHSMAIALLPVAIVCFFRALTTGAMKWKILAGVAAAAVVLSNAFGMIGVAMAAGSLLLAFPSRPCWKAPQLVAAIGTVSYCWISPWLSPAMIRAIRASAATSSGDYRYTPASWIALAGLAGGYLLLSLGLRRAKAPAHLQFFLLLAYVPVGIMLTWYGWKIAVAPQPFRYELEMDMTLPLAAVFAGGALLERLPKRPRCAVAVAVVAGLAVQTVHAATYAWALIRSAEPARLAPYKIAKWMDDNRRGERAFIAGSSSLMYNAFTDNPQLHGGHEQHSVNPFIAIVAFTIYSDMNARGRGAEYSVFWLKAFGVHAISVTEPDREGYYKSYQHPRKFEGVLPVLWREGDSTIYDVPGRSRSLAHVIPSSAVVARRPIHGLDIAPVEPYVAALDDPKYPPATFQWNGMSAAEIRATVERGQVVAVQVTYDRGWEAWSHGRRQPIRGDDIGQMVIDTDCVGPCEISLRFSGGWERWMTRAMSLAAMLVALLWGRPPGLPWLRRGFRGNAGRQA